MKTYYEKLQETLMAHEKYNVLFKQYKTKVKTFPNRRNLKTEVTRLFSYLPSYVAEAYIKKSFYFGDYDEITEEKNKILVPIKIMDITPASTRTLFFQKKMAEVVLKSKTKSKISKKNKTEFKEAAELLYAEWRLAFNQQYWKYGYIIPPTYQD